MDRPEFIEPQGVANLVVANPDEWEDAAGHEIPAEDPPNPPPQHKGLFSGDGEPDWFVPEGR